MDKILEVSGLGKTYKNGRGIEDIQLSLKEGEVFGLLGPNGAGKTTLLKCITGLLSPNHGQIYIFGKDITKNYKEAIRSVGAYVGSPTIHKHMTAAQNLRIALRYYPELPKSKIEDVLKEVGLEKFSNEKTANFSMGMLQRLELALVLIGNPRLIILDEPTNGLDIDGILLFRKVITERSRKGVSFLISSHVTSELECLCSRFGIIINGTFVHTGTVEKESERGTMEKIYLEKIGESSYERIYA